MQKKGERIKIRRSWMINPKTRIKKSKRAYSRKNKKALLDLEHERRLL